MEITQVTAEMAHGDSSSNVVKILRRLPILSGYLLLLILGWVVTAMAAQFVRLRLRLDLLSPIGFTIDPVTGSAGSALLLLLAVYLFNRPVPVYLVDFACSKPENKYKISKENFPEMSVRIGRFSAENMTFQTRIIRRSGLGDETYVPRGLLAKAFTMAEALAEAEMVMFGALDALFAKTGVQPKEVGILVVNCSIFDPTPSLSSMVVNHYKMRSDVKSFNLGGMGCSAGLISIDLVKHLLRTNPKSYAVVVSTENITLNWYLGNDRSMLLPNCIFRMGAAAVLLSNRWQDRTHSKYQLLHTVRTHTGMDDRSHNCVVQREDEAGIVGVSLGKDLMAVAGDALKTNITTLGPLVLPLAEQVMFFLTLVARKVMRMKVKPYIPDFEKAVKHFCIHAGGRAVLDEVQKSLRLGEWHMEPSRMTLHRFGNTSSSTLWYELAYSEAKGRINKGDRIWQIAFGSGFKCNSAVWMALQMVQPVVAKEDSSPWADRLDRYPVTEQN